MSLRSSIQAVSSPSTLTAAVSGVCSGNVGFGAVGYPFSAFVAHPKRNRVQIMSNAIHFFILRISFPVLVNLSKMVSFIGARNNRSDVFVLCFRRLAESHVDCLKRQIRKRDCSDSPFGTVSRDPHKTTSSDIIYCCLHGDKSFAETDCFVSKVHLMVYSIILQLLLYTKRWLCQGYLFKKQRNLNMFKS